MRGTDYYSSLDYSHWNRAQRLVKLLIALFVRGTMRVRVQGLERIPASGPAIIAGNHLSLFDVVVVIPYLPRPVILLLAEELRVWPWIDFVLGRLGNAILVRRGSGDRRPVDLGTAVLDAGGIVAVAPEGRRSSTGGLQRGRNGVARIAIRTAAPVVPVAIWGQEHALRSWRGLAVLRSTSGSARPRPTRTATRVPSPTLPPGHGRDRAAVAARVPRRLRVECLGGWDERLGRGRRGNPCGRSLPPGRGSCASLLAAARERDRKHREAERRDEHARPPVRCQAPPFHARGHVCQHPDPPAATLCTRASEASASAAT